jgi:type II secretion system protein G
MIRNIRRAAARGFTLIEILIVVVILGILAAIIIPQFTNAADDAGVASARTQLQTMRSQIELFRAQSDVGAYPAGGGFNCNVPPVAVPGPWTALSAGGYLRSANLCWPSGFNGFYTAATGDLTLTYTGTMVPAPDPSTW